MDNKADIYRNTENLQNSDYILFKNVSFKYDGSEKNALNGIDIKIPKGQMTAVLGHNGCGKSTFAKHINALLLPTEGIVRVSGISADSDENIWLIRSMAGMVFQNPDNQTVASVVEDEVAFGAENLGIETAQMQKNVDYALKTVGMEKYRLASTAELSGGQKQKISVAGILAMKPQCIIFDEATAMLDPSGRREVMETAAMLNKKESITIVFITHYMEEAALADRVIVMNDGVVVMDDVPMNIFTQVEKMKSLKLDVPQMTELAYRLKNDGFDIDTNVLTIDDMFEQLNKVDLKPVSEDCADYVPKGGEILRADKLSYTYSRGLPSQHTALDGVSFSVSRGEFICIIGHTGSGKSTLIQHLNGLLEPDSGCVYFDGKNIFDNKKELPKIRRHIGLVFQYPEHQLFEMTVGEDIAFAPKNMGLSDEEIEKTVKHSAQLVGLSDEDMDKSPFELSGGQKRRAAIAGVLAMQPEILVLDEPMAGLDPMGREEILSVIKRLNKEEGITVLLVSHSMEDAARLADRILVMNGGRAEIFDTPKNVFAQSTLLESIGLDVPQISKLFARLGGGLPKGVFTVDEAEKILMTSAVK